MRQFFFVFIFILLSFCFSQNSLAESLKEPLYIKKWHAIKTPTKTDGNVQVYGGYTAGCIDGATKMSKSGKGYKSVSSTGRIYGDDRLVEIIEATAAKINDEYNKIILVGDLSHPRGGPTSLKTSAHRSHQNGLDVDIWYNIIDKNSKARAVSMLSSDGKSLHSKRWGDMQSDLLEYIASFEDVERILVNPLIKKHMCEKHSYGDSNKDEYGDKDEYEGASWLKKLRPWWGHNRHFHTRLSCPKNSPYCESQGVVEDDGVGCGETLSWWFSDEAKQEGSKNRKKKRVYPKLPEQCEEVFYR